MTILEITKLASYLTTYKLAPDTKPLVKDFPPSSELLFGEDINESDLEIANTKTTSIQKTSKPPKKALHKEKRVSGRKHQLQYRKNN